MPSDRPFDMPFQPLDHAAAHERLADLALEADALDRVAASALPEDRALMAHLAGCESCHADVAASASLRDALRTAFQAMPDLPSLDPIQPPPALRAGVLAAARREPRSGEPRRAVPAGGRRWWDALVPRWPAAIAAALLVAVIGGAVGLQLGRHAGDEDAASMAGVVATLDRVLTADPHWVAPLQADAGTTVGSVSWSKSDFAVLTTALRPPADGLVYRCWLVHDGRWAVIGQMDFGGATAYWTGSVGDWATLDVSDGTRFVVTLEPAASPAPNGGPTSPVVLQADLTE